MIRARLAAVVLAAGILTAGCSTVAGTATMPAEAIASAEAQASQLDVYGELQLHDALAAVQGCTATSRGYDDIRRGAPVVIRDDSGKTVAVGSLLAGIVDKENGLFCTFGFTVEDVPVAPFYSVEVAGRGEVTFTQDELRDGPMVTLGDG